MILYFAIKKGSTRVKKVPKSGRRLLPVPKA